MNPPWLEEDICIHLLMLPEPSLSSFCLSGRIFLWKWFYREQECQHSEVQVTLNKNLRSPGDICLFRCLLLRDFYTFSTWILENLKQGGSLCRTLCPRQMFRCDWFMQWYRLGLINRSCAKKRRIGIPQGRGCFFSL